MTVHRFPLYYLPPDTPRPIHLVHLGGIRVADGIGPLDAHECERGGTIYGGPWDDQTLPLWKKTKAGWWMALGAAEPHHLARLDPLHGRLVPGKAAHLWLVPRLLQVVPDFGLEVAVAKEYRDYGWHPPASLRPLLQRLRDLFTWTPEAAEPGVPDDETVQLVADILALNYHLSVHELAVTGWLDQALVLNVLNAAAGITDAQEQLQATRGAAP